MVIFNYPGWCLRKGSEGEVPLIALNSDRPPFISSLVFYRAYKVTVMTPTVGEIISLLAECSRETQS